ncbi:Na/Pi cotransporter family protein [Caldisalinibacter kiritimatiensis]|nr:Na/Pi symporter [Caldisalinibacter kiritimatiensis]
MFAFGISLFLIGVYIMSSSFKNIASNKLRQHINKITSNRAFAVIIGIIITSLLQSSSATTIIIISLVHGKLINIYNAAPIIMGANIGTTITGQLISYKNDSMVPYLLIIGFLLFISPRKTSKVLGKVLMGLGLIFCGIEILSYSMSPLKSVDTFLLLINKINKNKLLGVLTGVVTTSIIQSSSTGVAILQLMASKAILPVPTAINIMLGQNIGTCTTTLVGSLATNRIGKQTAIIHLIFNLLGVVIFFYFTDYLFYIVYKLSPADAAKQIANAHTIFNTVTTIILLPFSSLIVKISKFIVKE